MEKIKYNQKAVKEFKREVIKNLKNPEIEKTRHYSCDKCHIRQPESRIFHLNGKKYCNGCFNEEYYEEVKKNE